MPTSLYQFLISILPSAARSKIEHKRAFQALSKKHPDTAVESFVVVSLTTTPHRIHLLHYTLGSLLSQTVHPFKIVVNLSVQMEAKLPDTLSQLDSSIIDFNYTDDIGPHTKLIPTLKKYANYAVVTCDDDIIYPQHWLKNLIKSSRIDPLAIHSYRAKKITKDKHTGEPLTYSSWENLRTKSHRSHPLIMPLGYAGVFYPAKSLHPDVHNQSLFKSTCPTADDMWFKFMSSMQGTKNYKSKYDIRKLVYVNGSQSLSLMTNNVAEQGNDRQFKLLNDHYNLF